MRPRPGNYVFYDWMQTAARRLHRRGCRRERAGISDFAPGGLPALHRGCRRAGHVEGTPVPAHPDMRRGLGPLYRGLAGDAIDPRVDLQHVSQEHGFVGGARQKDVARALCRGRKDPHHAQSFVPDGGDVRRVLGGAGEQVVTGGKFCGGADVTTAYLNGTWLPLEEARISPLDRGFLYGDAVYEVVHAYRGKPFRLERHVARLARSLGELRIAADPELLRTVVPELLERDSLGRRRGPGLPPDHAGRAAEAAARLSAGGHAAHRVPVRLALRADGRVVQPGPGADHPSRRPLGALRHQDHRAGRQRHGSPARQRGRRKRSGVRPRRRGDRGDAVQHLGSLRRRAAHRAALEPHPPGVKRDVVLEVCQRSGFPSGSSRSSPTSCGRADELFVTSTVHDVAPVRKIDGHDLPASRP